MTLRGVRVKAARITGTGRGRDVARTRARTRRVVRRARSLVAAGLGPVLAAGTAVMPVAAPVAAAAGVAAVAAAASVAAAPAAKAATGQAVLVLLQNGETTAPETTVLQNAGYTVTQATPSTWQAMSASQFEGYAALVIGDPSSGGTCSSLTQTTSTLGTTWQGAVNGNLAVLGTAPALPGSTAANTLITDTVGYAAAGFNSAHSGTATSGTGLYESLNCEYSTAAAGTAVPLLSGVEGIGTAGGLTVQGSLSCTDPGTVNTWEAAKAGTFGGFTSSSLATGPWSPGCPVQEGFDSWPAMFTPVAYDTAADAPAKFTASDGVTGLPYALLGQPVSSATAALAPSAGGEVLAGTTTGGTSNPAAPGVSQASAGDPVNTENGDFTQSNTDVSIPAFGPPLSFARTYDAGVAQQQTQAAKPGPLGYGWTDNWATSLSTVSPVPGDIYAAGGLRTGNGNGGPPAQSVTQLPGDTFIDGSGNIYIADTQDNRIQEIAATTSTQWGIQMTAGDVYTVAGSPAGYQPNFTGLDNGTPASQTRLNHPTGVMANSSGLFIADTNDCRIVEIAATSGTQWGSISMTANDEYTIAGTTGTCGSSGDNGVATSADLNQPTSIHFGAGTHSGDVYIADTNNNRIQEVAAAGETQWGKTMSANHIYTVAGSPTGGVGMNSGVTAANSLLSAPKGVTIDGSGNMLIADTTNCRIAEIPVSTGSYWGVPGTMTGGDIYTVAGRGGSANCTIGNDNKSQLSSNLNFPKSVRVPNGNMYIADTANNRIQEVAGTGHSEFGQTMTQNFVYTVAGDPNGAPGFSGNGGVGTSALMNAPGAVWLDSAGNLYASDTGNNQIRELSKTTPFHITALAGNGYTLLNTGDGGPAVLSGLYNPGAVTSDAYGDIFVADAGNNRVQEIAAYSHTQFGITMVAGDVYTVAGSSTGRPGNGGDGGPATSAFLSNPFAVAVDSSGNLYIADEDNSVIRKVSATGTISTIAGTLGASGYFGDGGPATSAVLDTPDAVAVDTAGDVFLADPANSLVQEIPATSGTHYGISMTAGDIYAIAGIPDQSGDTGNGGAGSSAKLGQPTGLGVDTAGNVYISDSHYNQVREVAVATGAQHGQQMAAGDIYAIAGSPAGTAGSTGDGGLASAALLSGPAQIALDSAGDLYITDSGNARVREIAAANGPQWSQSMTAGDIYTVAGSTLGFSGNGGPATAAQMFQPYGIGTDPAGDLFILQTGEGWATSILQEVTASATSAIAPAPGQTSSLNPAPGGITVTQPGGDQVTFYAQVNGACTAPYVAAGLYCVLPQFTGVTLTDNTGNNTFTYSTSPGAETDTYSWSGPLVSETDTAGNTLTITYQSPAPGSGHCPSTATSCETITAANGRTLVIGSNASSRVTSVTDPMSRTWNYAYNGASQLISATGPVTGETTSYTYGQGSTGNPLLASSLLTITGPNAQPGGPDAGDSTVNVYDSLGRVTSQTDPMGFHTTFNYCVNAAAGDCMNPATGTGFVTVTDPDGNTTVDNYDDGTLAAETHLTAGTVTSEHDYNPVTTAAVTSGGTLLNATETDGVGNTTSYTYDSSGAATSSTAPGPDGPAIMTTAYTNQKQINCSGAPEASSSATCTQDAGPNPVAPGGVITPPASAPPLGLIWTLYDTRGNSLYSSTGVFPPGSSSASYLQTTYQLFNGNSVTLNNTNITCTVSAPSPSLPCATISADGVVTQLGYDSAGDLTSSATPDGNGSQIATATYAYDGDGEQTSSVAPDGNLSGSNAGNYTTVTAYNADGKVASVTQAGGTGATVTPRTTYFGHDSDNNQTTVKDARGYTTTTAYNADDKSTLVTDPDGDSTLTCYDGDGNTAQTVPAVGVAASSLTPASCPTSYPSGYSTRLASDATASTFNALGEQIQQTTPAPVGQSGYETTTFTYDGNGNRIQTTAPATTNGGPSQVTVDTYNNADELASETTGYGTSAASTTTYCYGPDGNKTAVVAPDGNTSGTASCQASSPWTVSPSSYPTQSAYQTTNSYDSAGELVSTTTPATTSAPNGATTTSTYDPAGNLLTSTDPDSVTTTFTYTPLNLRATISYSGSSAHSVSQSYDANGARTAMTDATGNSSYIYDPFGELTSATNGAQQTTGYGYTGDGQITSITYPLPSGANWAATSTASYGYDNADRLNSITDFNSNKITITDTADGPPFTESLAATGDTINIGYDNTDSPSSVALKNSTSTLQSFTFTDAPAGDILTETDVPSSPTSPATYSYDAQKRVTSMTPGTGSQLNYSFDASGNLTTLLGGVAGTYDHASELTSAASSPNTTNYTYNPDGERLTATQSGTTLAAGTWNGAGQLTSYANSTANMSAASYDGDGRRASSTTTPAGGSAATQGYVWNSVPEVPQMIMDSANAYIYGPSGTPAEQVNLSTGAVTYLIADALGSVRGTVNNSGALTGTTSYDAWGTPQTTGGLTGSTPFGYAGGYTDSTGLIYLINRYYDPATRQFISLDPAISTTGQPFAYASGDPVNATDPNGLATLGICAGGSGQVGPIYAGVGGCLQRTINRNHHDDIGFTRTWFYGGGVGRGFSVTAYWEVSNATTLQQLGKWFNFVAGSLTIGNPGASTMFFWGRSGNKMIYGVDLGIAFGKQLNAAVGSSYTWVNQVHSSWWANILRWVWGKLCPSWLVGIVRAFWM